MAEIEFKRPDELEVGDLILSDNDETHKVRLTFTCEDHTRVVTDTDEIGCCFGNREKIRVITND